MKPPESTSHPTPPARLKLTDDQRRFALRAVGLHRLAELGNPAAQVLCFAVEQAVSPSGLDVRSLADALTTLCDEQAQQRTQSAGGLN